MVTSYVDNHVEITVDPKKARVGQVVVVKHCITFPHWYELATIRSISKGGEVVTVNNLKSGHELTFGKDGWRFEADNKLDDQLLVATDSLQERLKIEQMTYRLAGIIWKNESPRTLEAVLTVYDAVSGRRT